jgi:AcrR family transcriptional regulator
MPSLEANAGSSVATVEEAGTTGTGTCRVSRPRADAVRNRARIVAVARDVFLAEGPEAPLDEVAKRAGIGNATLYRHFADRRSLLQAVLLFIMSRTAEHAEREAAENTDALAALRRFMNDAIDERVGVVCGLLVDTTEQISAELAALCDRLETAGERLMERARRDGQIRTDVGLHELVVLMSQLARPLPGVRYRDADTHRGVDLLLDGLSVPAPAEVDGRAARTDR